ncbi:MAG: tetratricopeptide repeat protein [Acidobacteria bacterium]|nr:tetratricopeptide repeat protein [Acidobacteriota bacterium]
MKIRWWTRWVPLIVFHAASAMSLPQEPVPTVEAHLRLGQYFLENNAAGRAVSEFEAAAGLAPERADAHYNLGNALRLWGDASGAEKRLREALDIQPHFPEAHFVLGLLLGNRVGSEHLGLSEFEAAIAQKLDYAEAHFNIGIIHWKTDEAERALKAFRRAVKANPQSAEYRVRLGQTLARLNQGAEAITELKRAAALNPDSFEAHYQLGRTLLKQGEDKEAAHRHIEIAKRLKEKGQTAVEGDQSYLSYRQGLSALEQGRFQDAINLLTAALDGAHSESAVRGALGIAYQRKGDRAKAGDEFRRVIAIHPDSPDGRLNYGTLLMSNGDAGGAEREFQECLRIDPNFAEAHYNLGLVFASRRRWQEAMASLTTTLGLQPSHVRARWNLARVLRDSGDRVAALDEYRKACSADRTLVQAYLEYGELLAAGGETAAAIALWSEALRHHPTHRKLHERLVATLDHSGQDAAADRQRRKFLLLTEESDYQRGVRALDAGDFEQAVGTFRALLHLHPELDEVRHRLAVALFANHEYAAAAAEYGRLLETAPDDADLRLHLATTLLQAGSFAEAREELEHALRLNPDSAQAYHQMALTYWEEGERTRAMEFFHQARRLDPAITVPQ